jgi:hypothetical protein
MLSIDREIVRSPKKNTVLALRAKLGALFEQPAVLLTGHDLHVSRKKFFGLRSKIETGGFNAKHGPDRSRFNLLSHFA